jgi:KEOPS complex subunit Cgi121
MHLMEQEGRSLFVLGGRPTKPANSLLQEATALSGNGASVRLLNAELVFGMDHVRSAFQKAARAFDNGRNVSDSLATETMLYMSGCRQIQEAVELFRLKEDGGVVCLADTANGIGDKLTGGLSMKEDDEILTESAGKDAFKFGVGRKEGETVPKDRIIDLVLERVASVDVKKK